MKKLDHENVIRLYEVRLLLNQIIENEENYYFILEYASKGELFDYIVQKKRLNDNEASFFLVQMIKGLEYIHKNNIVHRDLKPENLLLNEHKQIKIIDFGLSNCYKTGRQLQTACGSPCYAAPEMIMGKTYNGNAVDIWSIGIVLFAMVCGYLPYEDPDNLRLYKKIVSGKLEFPSNISLVVKNLIRKILNVNPKQRLKLEEIKSHPFYKIGEKILKKEELVYDSNLPKLVLEKMNEIGYDKNEITQQLELKRHNSKTTVYYLILKKLKEKSVKKRSDIKILECEKLIQTGLKIVENKNININIKGLPKRFEGNININITEPNTPQVIITGSNFNQVKRNVKINRNLRDGSSLKYYINYIGKMNA
jgi:5'-AMP-activated protein kinase catalytic alpha subunit